MIRSREAAGVDSNPIDLSEYEPQVYSEAFECDDIIREIFSHLTTENPDRYSSKSGLLKFFTISKRVYEQLQYVRIQWIQVNLISLKIFGKLPEDSLLDIIVKYNMRHLNINDLYYNSEFFDKLVVLEPNVESLIINWSAFGKKYPKMNSLKYFSMGNSCRERIESVIKSYPLLEKVEHFCTCVNKNSMDLFAKHCLNLKSINLSGTFMTDVGVKALVAECLQEGVKTSVLGCKKLEVINLSSLEITDYSLEAIGENCKELKEITLQMTKVSIIGVGRLLQNCLKLEMIDLSLTSTVLKSEVETLRKAYPNVDIQF